MVSILPRDMTGVMFISGFRGAGKSFLASQADLPQNIVFLDFEDKGEGIDSQLEFGMYKALTQESGGDPLTLYSLFMETVKNIKQDKFTVLVIDNVSPLEVAMRVAAKNSPTHYANKYGLNAKNIQNERYGGAKAVVNFMVSDIASSIHSKGIKLIVCTSHIKNAWESGIQVPNRYNILGADRWQTLSILTLILIHGVNPPVPDALVQKEQLGLIDIPRNPTPAELEAMMKGEAGHVVKRRIPPRIPQCTFQKIRWYLENPADFNDLEKDEKPTKSEIDPFGTKLTKEQFKFVQSAIELQERLEREEQDELSMSKPQVDKINTANYLVFRKEYQESGLPMTPAQVMAFINENASEKVTIAGAVQIINDWKKYQE